jgi:hypothetical protein
VPTGEDAAAVEDRHAPPAADGRANEPGTPPLVGPERASSWIRPKGMVSLDKGDEFDTPAKL